MVSKDHKLSVRRQCALLTLVRSNLFYEPKGESAENLRFMEIIDKQFLEMPWYGSRQMARYMMRQGHTCGRHRVRRLMRLMRLVPIYQEPNTRSPATHACMRERGQEASAAQDLALPAEERGDRPPEPSLVRRHHLYPDATGLPVSGSHHGLV